MPRNVTIYQTLDDAGRSRRTAAAIYIDDEMGKSEVITGVEQGVEIKQRNHRPIYVEETKQTCTALQHTKSLVISPHLRPSQRLFGEPHTFKCSQNKFVKSDRYLQYCRPSRGMAKAASTLIRLHCEAGE